MVYVTAPSQDVALTLARIVIQKKHAACANILGPMTSVYEWQGKIHQENEWSVIFKTTRSAFKKLKSTIVKHHPYEVPALVAWPLKDGHGPFLEWVQSSSGA